MHSCGPQLEGSSEPAGWVTCGGATVGERDSGSSAVAVSATRAPACPAEVRNVSRHRPGESLLSTVPPPGVAHKTSHPNVH